MEMLGEKVDLAVHTEQKKYSGGLHHFRKEIEENGEEDRVKSGVYSLYTEHNNKGVMFHVSTLLPTRTDGTDNHQIEVRDFCLTLVRYIIQRYNENNIGISLLSLQKKKRIGNDMVCLIFQDGDTSFTPDLIPSQFLNCYIVVRPLEGNDEGKYKVSVTARSEISNSTPLVPEDGIFQGGAEFR